LTSPVRFRKVAAMTTPQQPIPRPRYDLARHPYFERWVDPGTGVESFILTERVAPVQQAFYFVNPSVSDDGRWLWFYCAFPPAPMRTLGVVCLDPDEPMIRHYPATQFHRESPLVLPSAEGVGIYFSAGPRIWKQPLEGEVEPVARLDPDYIAGRVGASSGLATHLTLSADGRHFLLDFEVGNQWVVGVADRASGEITVLHELGRKHNHGQFSLHDPDLFLIAQDWWRDPISGRYLLFDQRTWLMNVSQTRFEPLCPELWFNHNSDACHEWWSPDGRVCWVDYKQGVFACDPQTRQREHIWRRPLCHAHATRDGRFWCGDQTPYFWHANPCQVLFYDRQTDREIHVVTGLPLPAIERTAYHIDPHPHFSPDDGYLIYTTTVHDGRPDVAISPTAGIVGAIS